MFEENFGLLICLLLKYQRNNNQTFETGGEKSSEFQFFIYVRSLCGILLPVPFHMNSKYGQSSLEVSLYWKALHEVEIFMENLFKTQLKAGLPQQG